MDAVRFGNAKQAKFYATAAACDGAAALGAGAAYHSPGCRVMSRVGLMNISAYCGSCRKAGTSSAKRGESS